MMFVYPSFLWALATVSIPIIIHLFNFQKYKKVYFTNVRFLKEIRQESQSRSRLREILILLCRCLAISCLVLAFAQPVIRSGDEKNISAQNAVSIYIDNSFSMNNVNKQGMLLDIAKQRAAEIVNSHAATDKFQILTNDFEGRHQRFHTKEDAITAIEGVKASPVLRRFTEVVKRQSEFLGATGRSKKIFTLSDAQQTTFNITELRPDTTISLYLVPLAANRVNNAYVDSCWFETPMQQKGFIQKLHAKIVNLGTSAIEAGSARLFINEKQISLSSFTVSAGSSAEIVFTFECREAGLNFGAVKIEDYPVTFDDELFFCFNSRVSIPVCLINGRGVTPADPFSTLFKADSLFRLSVYQEQTIDYSAFRTCSMIVLNGLSELSSGLTAELMKFSAKGGCVVIIPSETGAENYNPSLAALKMPVFGSSDTSKLKADRVLNETGFYNNVFEKKEDRVNMPLVTRHYKILTGIRSGFEPVITLGNGDPFFGLGRLNNSQIFLFSSGLEGRSGNFSKHALFVPTLYMIAFRSVSAPPLFYTAGSNVSVELSADVRGTEMPPHIVKLDKRTDIIPELRMTGNRSVVNTRGQVTEPGFYTIRIRDSVIAPLAFNYTRLESDLSAWQEKDLAQLIEEKGWRNVRTFTETSANISAQVALGGEGLKLWKLFIILALAFIALEVLLLKLLR